ncbi:hypothetical protein ACXR0O_13940 [Verrucomicrobiota bacterium sgz303538]
MPRRVVMKAFGSWLSRVVPAQKKGIETETEKRARERLRFLIAKRLLDRSTAPEALMIADQVFGERRRRWSHDSETALYRAAKKAREYLDELIETFPHPLL